MLRAAHLSLGQATPRPLDPSARIFLQIPAAGETARKGTPVDVFFKQAPPPRKPNGERRHTTAAPNAKTLNGGPVPAITMGISVAVVAKQMAGNGVVPRIEKVFGFAAAPPGTLVATEPAAGTYLEAGDILTLLVSAGPTRLAVDDSEDVVVIDGATGRTVRRIATGPQAEKDPTFAPDGTRLAYTADRQILVRDLRTGRTIAQLADTDASRVSDPSWAPATDRDVLAVARWSSESESDLCFAEINGESLVPRCKREPGTLITRSIHWATDGKSVFASARRDAGPQSGIMRWHSTEPFSTDPRDWSDGAFVTDVSQPDEGVIDAVISPDGKTMAVAAKFGTDDFRLYLTSPDDFRSQTPSQRRSAPARSPGDPTPGNSASYKRIAGAQRKSARCARLAPDDPSQLTSLRAQRRQPRLSAAELVGEREEPSAMTLVTRMAGDYEIVDEIGERGGMAVVYVARQPRLDRDVALKQVDLRGGGELVERFVREAKLAGSLNHPNIVTVHDFFEHDGMPYIAMEYLHRGSLRPWVGSLSLQQSVGVIEGMLAGLSHAHGDGLVHRDIKPENILVTTTGGIKLADFGIARAFARVTGRLTKTGMTVGTPAYMAPEQALDRQLGPWTDLYSTGVVAYEMLLGRLPFEETDTPSRGPAAACQPADPATARARPEPRPRHRRLARVTARQRPNRPTRKRPRGLGATRGSRRPHHRPALAPRRPPAPASRRDPNHAAAHPRPLQRSRPHGRPTRTTTRAPHTINHPPSNPTTLTTPPTRRHRHHDLRRTTPLPIPAAEVPRAASPPEGSGQARSPADRSNAQHPEQASDIAGEHRNSADLVEATSASPDAAPAPELKTTMVPTRAPRSSVEAGGRATTP